MENNTDFWQFFEENKNSLKQWIEIKIELFHLKFVRKTAQIGGLILWLLFLSFFVLLILFFTGMTIGFWISGIFKSYVIGFSLTSLIYFLLMLLLMISRKVLFINPIIRILIRMQTNEDEVS